MNLVKVILILALLFGALFALAAAVVGNRAVDALAEQAQQPDSAADVIMRSRETAAVAPQPADRSDFFGAGLLALLLLLATALVFLMQGGAGLLKQWRLARKRPKRRRSRQTPYVTTWIEPSGNAALPQLPEVDDDSLPDPFA